MVGRWGAIRLSVSTDYFAVNASSGRDLDVEASVRRNWSSCPASGNGVPRDPTLLTTSTTTTARSPGRHFGLDFHPFVLLMAIASVTSGRSSS